VVGGGDGSYEPANMGRPVHADGYFFSARVTAPGGVCEIDILVQQNGAGFERLKLLVRVVPRPAEAARPRRAQARAAERSECRRRQHRRRREPEPAGSTGTAPETCRRPAAATADWTSGRRSGLVLTMHGSVRLASCAVLAAAGCETPSAVATVAETQRVVIDNPHRAQLALDYAAHAEAVRPPARSLGAPRRLDLALPLGRAALEARLGERTWWIALPLPHRAERPAIVRVVVAEPPPPLTGFAWIPGGPAVVGDVLGVGQEDERPARVVDVPSFWLGVTEVTNAEFAAFLDDVDALDPSWVAFDSRRLRIRRSADGTFATDAPDLPVVTVSHAGALAYCAWRSQRTGRRHRLPTEREWEKAARGPWSWTYSYGDVFRQGAANQQSGALGAVAQHDPTPFGLFDLTGNAFEWVADPYPRDSRGSDAEADPGYRSLRGGSFVLDGMFLRNSMRMKLRPDTRADDVGFRVAIDDR
jgi:formylglycine-generating enzyme required for sulfatase activity